MPGSSQHCCTQRLASAGTAISPGPAACRAALGRLSCQHAYMFSPLHASPPFRFTPHSLSCRLKWPGLTQPMQCLAGQCC